MLLRASGCTLEVTSDEGVSLSAPAAAGLSEALRAVAGPLAHSSASTSRTTRCRARTKPCRRGATTPTTLSCSPRRGLLCLSRRSPSRPTPGSTSPASRSTSRAGRVGRHRALAPPRDLARRGRRTRRRLRRRDRYAGARRVAIESHCRTPHVGRNPAMTTALPRRPLLLSALALPLLLVACSGAWSETTVPDSAFTEMPTGREDAEELFLAADQAFRSGDAVSCRLFGTLFIVAPHHRGGVAPSGIQATCDTMGVDAPTSSRVSSCCAMRTTGASAIGTCGSRGSDRTSPTSRTATRRR